jgi:DNA polymerase III subunit chi
MGEVGPEMWFYHLERSTLEEALPPLLEKSLQRGWRALIRCDNQERLAQLDSHLWTYKDESFLPHGLDTEHSPRQPILLTATTQTPNGAQVIFLIGECHEGDVSGVERVIRLFEASNDGEMKKARLEWTAAKASGRTASYWKQSTNGRWEKAA